MDKQIQFDSTKECLERIKQTFSNLYPEYYTRVMSATDEEFDDVYQSIITEVQEKAIAKIQASNMPEELKMNLLPILSKTKRDDDVHYTDSLILVGQATCDLLVNSRGDEIGIYISELLETQQQLQQQLSNQASLKTELIVKIISDCLSSAFGGIAATATIAAGILAIPCAGAAAIATIVAGVSAILDVLICQVIPLIFKDATCFMLLINKTNKNIKMVEGCDAHGHSEAMTKEITKIMVADSTDSNVTKNYVYSVGIYSTKKNSGALYGTKYGMQFKLIEDNTTFAVGVECPLNGPNKCYVAFNETARQAADGTQKKKSQYAHASNDHYVIEQRCDTKESKMAFFITTITEK